MSKNFNGSRRRFIKNCAIGAAAFAAKPLLGFTSPALIVSSTQKILSLNSYQSALDFKYSLDQDWLFGGKFTTDSIDPAFNVKSFSKITLPHNVANLSWQYWDPALWQDLWVYRRHFDLPPESNEHRIFLNFDGVMVGSSPVINGHTLPQHLGGYLPFGYEITQWVKDKENVLTVIVDSRDCNVPPSGTLRGAKKIDYFFPGGIIRSVYLRSVPQIFIEDVFAEPINVLDNSRSIKITCMVDAGIKPAKSVQIRAQLLKGDNIISSTEENFRVYKEGETEVTLNLTNLGNVKLWNIKDAYLYDLFVTLLVDGKPIHNYYKRIGLRDARFELDGFYLNGKRIQLFGLNRHELYPYVGYAMPPRVMRKDAEILKHELNCNIVRCSHYPQNEAFLNACDELGLLVWEEVPGWGYIGDDAWQKLILQNVRDMVVRDRNHPSIIVWGVRANETDNNTELWGTAKAIAKSLDESRQTTGAMLGHFRSTENWVQDVFSSNDYSCNRLTGKMILKEPLPGVPYFISEAVGQVVGKGPTADHVYSRINNPSLLSIQAIYHAQAHDQAAEYKQISGVAAWCGFDYASPSKNSYNDVKYPGVVDFFRIPKLGASFYQSQIDPKARIVIKPNFYWDFGPNSPNGPGSNAAIFSNCEELKIYIDGQLHSTILPDKEHFPNTKYPPFFADLEIINTILPVLRIDGYISRRMIISKSFSSDPAKDKFFLKADDEELIGDGADSTRLEFKVVDQFGELRYLGIGNVSFSINGPGIIIGDNPFSLADSGGAGAVWIKSIPDSSGEIYVEAVHSSLGSGKVNIKVLKEKSTIKI